MIFNISVYILILDLMLKENNYEIFDVSREYNYHISFNSSELLYLIYLLPKLNNLKVLNISRIILIFRHTYKKL